MPVIRRLPETTANRIAAGEVVERPAAAVKELVENALDAGATRIQVTLEESGIGRILVEDDGCGMDAADLALAVERHATSKLPEEAALFRIATLGFRGEALPSIGAVARLAITSRLRGAAEAHRITVEAGRKSEVRPAAGPPGTRVEVRDLFFATPARRKFLRAPRTEAEHAVEAVRRLALAWPDVAFRVVSDGREALALAPAADRVARLRDLLGAEFAAAAVPVRGAWMDLTLDGLAALPGYTRATAAEQHLVVNRRPVRDPLLRMALRVAYRGLIAAGRHPVAALFLDIPPEAVDVNVHPMKTELRFREADRVRGALIASLRRALEVGAGAAVAGAAIPPAAGTAADSGAEAVALGTGVPGFALATPAPPAGAGGFAEAPPLPLGFGATVAAWAGGGRRDPPNTAPQDVPAPPTAPATASPADPATAAADALPPLGRPLAQILETYILAEAPDGALILVDQHAAHERLTHEALRAQLLGSGAVRSQPLLLPAVVSLPPADAARLLAEAETLARLGLEIEAFGPGAVLVRALPALLGTPDPAPLLRDLADEFAESGTAASSEAPALEARLDAAIARLACHGSVRAGRRLTVEEMAALLRAMEATPRAATCSHGRPTVLRLGRGELERLFGRR